MTGTCAEQELPGGTLTEGASGTQRVPPPGPSARHQSWRWAAVAALGAVLAVSMSVRSGGPGVPSARRAQSVAPAGAASLEAYRRYVQGKQCADAGIAPSPTCAAAFEKALELDPAFALAWYELALHRLRMGAPQKDVEHAMAQAMANLDRAPPSDQLKIRAVDAQLEGREDDAASLFQKAADGAENDRSFLMLAAEFFLTRNEADLALPLLERSLALAGGDGRSAVHLVSALANLGRVSELRELEQRLGKGPQTPAALNALLSARAWLGDGKAAIDAGRRAVALAADAKVREESRWFLAQSLIQFGGPGIEHELLESCVYPPFYAAVYLTLHGRQREARALMDRGALAGCPQQANVPIQRGNAVFLTAAADARRMWPFAERARQLNPGVAASLAANFAYVGDLEHAKRLAEPLYPGSPRRQLYEAVVQWRNGERESALSTLRRLSARTPFTSAPPVIAPIFLYGELLAELGDCASAIDALQSFRTGFFPLSDQWSWTYPRSLLLSARCHERLGHQAKARRDIDELLALWARADPDLPLLAEARALKQRLSTGKR